MIGVYIIFNAQTTRRATNNTIQILIQYFIEIEENKVGGSSNQKIINAQCPGRG